MTPTEHQIARLAMQTGISVKELADFAAVVWKAGWESGVNDQAHWDGWRWTKGHPTPNPYITTQERI